MRKIFDSSLFTLNHPKIIYIENRLQSIVFIGKEKSTNKGNGMYLASGNYLSLPWAYDGKLFTNKNIGKVTYRTLESYGDLQLTIILEDK
jgi:hypothetical protein